MEGEIHTILDVLDSFILSTPNEMRDLRSMPGRVLYQLGEEVRRFAGDYMPPSPPAGLSPCYLGGWPSANFWDSQAGSLAMTSLLYSGQLLAKDPISDWFSVEQYSIPAMMSARPGFVDRVTGKPNVAQTRAFLLRIVPALYRLRPLIEKGLIILVPSKRYIAQHLDAIGSLATVITERVGSDIGAFTKRFGPGDMPMEDNVRGILMLAGGEREKQVRKALFHAVRYFAAEYSLAAQYGFHYTAPFEFEAFLCAEGLTSAFEQPPGARVLRAIFNSRLSIFRGLTPELVASLREDDNFGLFRANLFQTYKDIPGRCTQDELDQYLIEAEAAMIEPCLATIEREATRGLLSRIGVNLGQTVIRMGAGVIVGIMFSDGHDYKTAAASAGVAAISGFLANLVKSRREGAPVIWKSLLSHGQEVADEMPHSQIVRPKQEMPPDAAFWGIPEKPSTQVFVTGGTLIMDSVVSDEMAATSDRLTGSPENPYGQCPCFSGRKYKFCCKGLDRSVNPEKTR